jgi:uncharacterized cupin superfamily protein
MLREVEILELEAFMSTQDQRLNQLRHGPGGATNRIVATCASTGNCHFAMEATEPPGGGPPLHRHSREDEWFYTLEGELTLWLDGERIVLPAGNGAFAPRGRPHTFKNCSDKPVRFIVMASPGGIEEFFDFGLPNPDGSAPTEAQLMERIRVLAPKFGLEVLGPSPL